MKIIQIIPDFGLAGAETMCENLTLELVKAGHSVTVISMFDYHSAITERLEKAGIEIIYLNKNLGIDFTMIPKMVKVFKKINPDVIHTHRNCPQYAIPAAIVTGVKCRVHTVHNVANKENAKLARILNKFFFKHCHLIPVALSELIRDTIVEEYDIEKEMIPVILNGIDLSKCIPKDDYSISGKFKILHIGRFSEQKNHIGLLQGYKLFCEKYPDSELWLIGDGEKKKEIETFALENNLSANVNFLGLQSYVYNYLHNADVFTLPSNYEGIPMTLIEAMGTGLPIVATAVGGVPDMIKNGESGILINSDPQEIADGFCLLAENQNLRKTIGENALKKSVSFSAMEMAKEYLKVY
ncbi:glycosyltransferase [Holdemania filiformis]|uniref:glycosyltransferase n=1 Tax=Holdemania filiformis TaxID=61171 RepID=UPI0026773E95|nr:glycosyltransferase [Holdemania filiformis]